jgi:hypothetical protein
MRRANRPWTFLWGLVPTLVGLLCFTASSRAAGQTADTPPSDVVSGSWQHHKVTFTYDRGGCGNLERRAEQILVYLGARKDAKVYVKGCGWPDEDAGGPAHNVFAEVDFYTLAPVADGVGEGTVKARWKTLQVTPQHPEFMSASACELIDAMKDIITKNFSLRDIEYRTDCHPEQNRMDAFEVKGQVLQAAPLGIGTNVPWPVLPRGFQLQHF